VTIKVARFGQNHLHLLENHGRHVQIQCICEPSYMRCTAPGVSPQEFRSMPRGGSRKYYEQDDDGGIVAAYAEWDSRIPCFLCDEEAGA